MILPRLVLCSGAEVPARKEWAKGRKVVELDTLRPGSNAHLRTENVADAFRQRIPPRLVDLLEIATYVYAADCEASRECAWVDDKATEPWARRFHFVAPVRDLEFWGRDDVQERLVEALEFLSSDRFGFTFTRLTQERPVQDYLQIEDVEDSPFYEIDRVTMFSGGLDSLAGAVEAVAGGGKLVAVSHRPARQIDQRQRDLFRALCHRFGGPMMHIPVWVNKSGLDREFTQRTRSFLFSALGTAVASVLHARGVRFAENGVISLNFPLAAEVLRSRASRTTHPEALQKLEAFHRPIVESPSFAIENSYILKTKTDVVSCIAEHGAADLIGQTCSCSHTMYRSKTQSHCGRCGQCIDRRIAILSAGLEEHDSVDDYVTDVFTGPRKEGYDHNIAVNYVRFANEVDKMSEGDIATRCNLELERAARCFENDGEIAPQFIEMHKRHARSVCEVLDQQLLLHAKGFRDGSLDRTSLLGVIGLGEHLQESVAAAEPETEVAGRLGPGQNELQRDGQEWTVGLEGTTKHHNDTRGMRYIAFLLQHPEEEFGVRDLGPLVDGAPPPADEYSQVTAKERQVGGIAPEGPTSDNESIDPQGEARIRREIDELEKKRDFAELGGDRKAVAEAERELKQYRRVMASGLGMGGRHRRFSDESEKARQRVSKAIHSALGAMGEAHPHLCAHLRTSLLPLGYTVSYTSPADTRWTF